jgi:hypothetical protein
VDAKQCRSWNMAMIEHNPVIDLNLSKQDVESYILRHGWQQVDHPNKNLQVFAGLVDNDGRSIRLVLPLSNDLKDTPLRIYQAVQTIADTEDRSLNAVVADIEHDKEKIFFRWEGSLLKHLQCRLFS